MRNPIHVATAAVATACVIAFWPTPVWADPLSVGSTNTIAQGTSSGEARFDREGIKALANQPGHEGRQDALPNGASTGAASPCGSGLTFIPGLGCYPQPPPYWALPVCPPPTPMFTIGCFTVAPPFAAPGPSGPPPTTGPAALALQALAQKPWPQLQIGVNPDSSGLTGLPSWFWISGDPRVADATASVPGLAVTVHAQLTRAIWNFGDGRQLDSGTDLGQPYPVASTVQHQYETDSFGVASGYTVECVLHYLVTYTINGGPLQPLGEWLPTYTRTYVVRQLQPQAIPVPHGG